MQAVIIFLLFIAVLLVIFTLQNATEISVNIFFWEISNVPVVLVIIGCIIIGYLLTAIYYYPLVWKLKRELKQLTATSLQEEEEDYNFEVKTKKDVAKEKEDKDLHVEGYLMDED